MLLCRREKFVRIIAFFLLISFFIFIIPEPAWLLAQEKTGDDLLERGKQLYREGRFEEARGELLLAVELLSDKDKLIDAYLHLALCHFALGERSKAKESLAGLLRLNPGQQLDPMYYPPDFVKLLDETKGVILAHITIETEPTEAQVYLDGELIGLSPLELKEAAAGEHKLKIVKQGYKSWEQSLILKEGEEKTISIWLEKEKKAEEVKKPIVRVTPSEKKPEVKKGKRWLWILIGGAAAAAVAILARGGGKESGAPSPSSQGYGSIQVKSYPNGASIFLDGQNTGYKTNHTLTNISAGRHTILLRLAGWKDWEGEVTVSQNQTAVVKPCLLPPNGCFRDNFQDGDADGWDLHGDWHIKKEGGNYFLEAKGPDDSSCYSKPLCDDRGNLKLSFRLKIVSYGGYNGVFWVDIHDGPQGNYFLLFDRGVVLFGEWLRIESHSNTLRQTRGISTGSWYNIEIIAQGDNFQLFIGNNLMFNIHHYEARLKQGGFKFYVQEGCKAQIDDVVITSDECP
jgi:hypothetical protein